MQPTKLLIISLIVVASQCQDQCPVNRYGQVRQMFYTSYREVAADETGNSSYNVIISCVTVDHTGIYIKPYLTPIDIPGAELGFNVVPVKGNEQLWKCYQPREDPTKENRIDLVHYESFINGTLNYYSEYEVDKKFKYTNITFVFFGLGTNSFPSSVQLSWHKHGSHNLTIDSRNVSTIEQNYCLENGKYQTR